MTMTGFSAGLASMTARPKRTSGSFVEAGAVPVSKRRRTSCSRRTSEPVTPTPARSATV